MFIEIEKGKVPKEPLSVDSFKQEARKHQTHNQAMIRRLLDLYVARHREASPRPGE